MGSEKLLPCPFCGTAPDISQSQLAVSVGCDNNDCPARECHAAGPIADEAKIIAAWNTRAPAELTGWQPIETLAMWDVAIVTDGENVAKAQKAEADYGGHYFSVDPEDCLEWEPTLWIACPGDEATTRAPADLRSALEAETIERCAKVAEEAGPFVGCNPDCVGEYIATAIRNLAPTKGDVS